MFRDKELGHITLVKIPFRLRLDLLSMKNDPPMIFDIVYLVRNRNDAKIFEALPGSSCDREGRFFI
jgi:hypothetical protein